jgi:hypothetical protein
MAKVFLGGTTNRSHWRDDIIKKLKIDYFNPVVSEWTDEAYQNELKERETADFLLYVITPKMTGFYSIAEVIDDSNKSPKKTIFCFIENDGEAVFSAFQLKSLNAVGKMVHINGGKWAKNMDEVVEWLNAKATK